MTELWHLFEGRELWKLEWIVGLWLSVAFLSWRLTCWFPWLLATTWGYFLGSAILHADLTQLGFVTKDGIHAVDVGHSSATAALLLVVIPALVILLPRRGVDRLFTGFQWIWFLSPIVILFAGFGVAGPYSWDLCVSAMVFPSLFRKWDWGESLKGSDLFILAFFALCVAVTLYTGAASAWYVLGGAGLGALWATGHRRLAAVPPVAGFALAAAFAQGGALATSGRWKEWVQIWDWFQKNADALWGTGTGTFEWTGPVLGMISRGDLGRALQGQETLKNFTWLHNDWLQLVIEGGWVGFGLFLASALYVVWHSRRRPWLLASWAAVAVTMVSQFPLHWFVTQLWMALLVRETLWDSACPVNEFCLE